MKEENCFNATGHYEILQFVFSVFGKGLNNVVFQIGNNHSTNGEFERCLAPIFVGCFSNFYNLAINEVIALSEASIDRIWELISCANSPIKCWPHVIVSSR